MFTPQKRGRNTNQPLYADWRDVVAVSIIAISVGCSGQGDEVGPLKPDTVEPVTDSNGVAFVRRCNESGSCRIEVEGSTGCGSSAVLSDGNLLTVCTLGEPAYLQCRLLVCQIDADCPQAFGEAFTCSDGYCRRSALTCPWTIEEVAGRCFADTPREQTCTEDTRSEEVADRIQLIETECDTILGQCNEIPQACRLADELNVDRCMLQP
jgi:hypothetical protein